MKILVVEDNLVNQRLISTILRKSGFEFHIVENGMDAFSLYQLENFGLILMDCQLPIMDGYRAAQSIRSLEQDENLPRIPILALTANAMTGDRERCFQAGMDDFLSKPFRMDELIEKIKLWEK